MWRAKLSFDMGRDKKTSKGRLDKFYKLAKEQGFRARSAFKLVQLNKKYNFLYKSRVLIDLCAAPGGWLQVAAKYMPVSSVIIGVDLVPIKPIPNVTTIVGDITSDKCRADIKKELKTWKADVVLHDGSPNMGAAWLQDAYTQVELTLRSLKLATEMLMEGGIFITKVFRSKDYNALLWVLNQLFNRVEVTKPSSSRQVSAEIYIACFGFLAPKSIDPKLLDPKHVFSEIQEQPKGIDILHPEKKRRSRDGYEDGNYTLFKKTPVSAFIEAKEPVTILSTFNQIVFEGDELSERVGGLPQTNEDIRSYCQDLKLLSKSDFKQLIKWRSGIMKMLEKEKEQEDKADKADEEEENEEDDSPEAVAIKEELALDAELEDLEKKAQKDKHRVKRKENERKAKLRERLKLKMILPDDNGPEEMDQSLFTLKAIRSKKNLSTVASGEDILSSDEETEPEGDDDKHEEEDVDVDGSKAKQARIRFMERALDNMYEEFLQRKDPKAGRKRRRLSSKALGHNDDDDEDEDDEDNEEDGEENPLLVDPGQEEANGTSVQVQKAKADQWFSQPLFSSILTTTKTAAATSARGKQAKSGAEQFDEEDDNEDEEIRQMMKKATSKKAANKKRSRDDDEEEEDDEMELDDGLDRMDGQSESESDSESSDDDDEDDFDEVSNDEDADGNPKRREPKKMSSQELAFASILVNKGKEALIDEGFNRFAFDDRASETPSWFMDDEKKNFAPNLNKPITKAEVEAIKQKVRELDAMPIKKVIEARARNKKKMQRQMERLKKKADIIADDSDISERQKSQQIQQLFKKIKKEKDEIKYVVAKGQNRGKPTRPAGVQGRYKMVDSRLRKDKRLSSKAGKRSVKGPGSASKKK